MTPSPSILLASLLLCLAACDQRSLRREVDPTTAQVLEESELADGHLHGASRTWYSDGTLREQGFWEHGVPTGPRTLWHPTGKEQERGAFVDGLRAGPWASWYADGAPEWSGLWLAGDKHGTWTLRDPDGAVLMIEEWEHGTRRSFTRSGADG